MAVIISNKVDPGEISLNKEYNKQIDDLEYYYKEAFNYATRAKYLIGFLLAILGVR